MVILINPDEELHILCNGKLNHSPLIGTWQRIRDINNGYHGHLKKKKQKNVD